MGSYFLKAVKIINSRIIFVFLLALTNMHSRNYPLLSLLFFIVALILYAGVFGYFSEIVKKGKGKLSFSDNVKRHFSNILVVSIILGLPVFLLTLLGFKPIGFMLFLAIRALTLYVFPFVFIGRINIEAIPLGIKFLLRNFKENITLLIIVVLIPIITFSSMLFMIKYLAGISSGIILFAYLSSLIKVYLNLLLFLVASMALIKHSSPVPK